MASAPAGMDGRAPLRAHKPHTAGRCPSCQAVFNHARLRRCREIKHPHGCRVWSGRGAGEVRRGRNEHCGEIREKSDREDLGWQWPRSCRAAAPSRHPRDGAGGKCTITLARSAALPPHLRRAGGAQPRSSVPAVCHGAAGASASPAAPRILLRLGLHLSRRLAGRPGGCPGCPGGWRAGRGAPLAAPAAGAPRQCPRVPPALPPNRPRRRARGSPRSPRISEPAHTRQVNPTPAPPSGA